MNFPRLWIAGLSAAALAVFGTYLWCEGIPFSVMNPAANTPPARPVRVTAGVVEVKLHTCGRAYNDFWSAVTN